MTGSSDPFEDFAERTGLRMSAQPVYSAPRDVLEPPADSEQCFLVTLEREGHEHASVTLAYLVPMGEAPPRLRQVLWWVAADAWALEQARHEIAAWAAGYGHSPDDAATATLFATHRTHDAALRELVGEEAHRQLIALYCAQVSLPKSSTSS